MKITPVSKLKKYQGPKYHNQILTKIYEDAQKEGIDISPVYIKKVIYLFFSLLGISYHFQNLESFEINDVGKWVLNAKGRKARRRKVSMDASHVRRVEKKRSKRNLANFKLLQDKAHVNGAHVRLVTKFNETNNELISRDLKPWKWNEYCRMKKRTLFISWGTEINIYRRYDPKKYIPLK